jgi:hypothetical protein
MPLQSKEGAKTPISNATEIPVKRIDVDDFIESYRGPHSSGRRPPLAAMDRVNRDKVLFEMEQRNKEATFNAIVADLGQPRKMGGVKGTWNYQETKDLMDKDMADGVFGYSKSTVEAAIRRHLGLPTTPQ